MEQTIFISEAFVSEKFGFTEELIGEDAKGPIKALICEGEFQRAEAKNRNGRVYSESLLARETAKLAQVIRDRNGLPMGMDHPLPGDDEKSMILIQRQGLMEAAGLCVNLEMNNKVVYGKAKVIEGDHGAGDKLAAMIRMGWKPGVSSRGLGGKPVYHNDGSVYVPEDYNMITYDWVSNPSTHNAILTRKFNEEMSILTQQNHKTGLWAVMTDFSKKYGELK